MCHVLIWEKDNIQAEMVWSDNAQEDAEILLAIIVRMMMFQKMPPRGYGTLQ